MSEPLRVTISEDSLEARVGRIFPGTTVNDVLAALRTHDVGMGIRHDAIAEAVRRVTRTGEPMADVLVARGVRPRPPSLGVGRFRVPDALVEIPDLEAVRAAFGARRVASLARACERLSCWLVREGDALWTADVDFGEPGVDLLGRMTPPPRPAKPVSPPAGPGVTRSADGTLLRAARAGFAGWLDGRLAVLPPVWVQPDGERAYVVQLAAPGGRVPKPEGLLASVESAGVRVGLDGVAVTAACEAWPLEVPLVEVARAIPPQPPVPGVPTFFFEHEFRVGAEGEDGRTDFKDRNLFPAVVGGALLAECPPTTPGVAGTSVTGAAIDPGGVPDTSLEALENVRLVVEGEVQRAYAKADGGATVRRRVVRSRKGLTTRFQIAVRTVARIPGDVGLKTGHIRFDGNVEVQGSVGAGFEVIASGDILVKGRVEAGARVGAKGNVTVKGGIVGAGTVVSARGSLHARFVQGARIRAGHDIKVVSYCHEAQVEAGGRIEVPGKGGQADGIVGGVVWAVGEVVASNIGSESNPNTVVVAGVNRRLDARRAASQDALRMAQRALKKQLRALGVRDPRALDDVFLDPEATDPRTQAMWAAHTTLAECAGLRAEIEELRHEAHEVAAVAAVVAKRTAHLGTQIRVGPYTTQVERATHGVRFHVDAEGERGGVLATPARKRR